MSLKFYYGCHKLVLGVFNLTINTKQQVPVSFLIASY